MKSEYHPPSLVKLSAKGGKYYVCVTMPKALWKKSQKQMKRSTGTTDERIAKMKIVSLAKEIYAKFDQMLSKLHQDFTNQANQPAYTNTIGDFTKVYTVDPFLIRLHGLDKDPAHNISKLMPNWISHLEKTGQGSPKERSSRKAKLEQFVGVVGDLNVDDIKKQHAYQFAEWLNNEGKANKTIRSLITKISAFLTWCEQTGKIESSPFNNLKLSFYGVESLSYLPFDPDELQAIFAQEMAQQDRLCLSLLAVTGARLDEIALLKWDQVKCDFGITYLDLRPDITKVKTDGSHRVIPVHPAILGLLKEGQGRVFDYPRDRNGKAQNAASRRLMKYIRTVTDEERKVIHSFRGTFKQMLENAGITSEMTSQLEKGEISLDEISKVIKTNKVEKRVHDKITGHAARDVSGKYGFGPLLIPRAVAIQTLDVGFLGLPK
jgi:integrase